jgi:hypothetical protein
VYADDAASRVEISVATEARALMASGAGKLGTRGKYKTCSRSQTPLLLVLLACDGAPEGTSPAGLAPLPPPRLVR